MSQSLRIGLTGAGDLGTALGDEVESVVDTTLVAVADVDQDTRADAADRFDIDAGNRYSDHETMLDEAALDAVVVATPHTLHYDQVVAAMERDVHTLCEKPLCTDLAHARDLVERAESGDTVLAVGYQRHLSPVYATARRRLPDATGGPSFLTAEITQNWVEHVRGTWRADPELSGGGQLYDTGSHLLDAVCWVTGLTPESLDAQMVFDDDAGRVDKHAVLDVRFAEGAVASIAVSGDVPRTSEHIRVWGPDGGVRIDGEGWDRRELSILDEDGTTVRPGTDDWVWPSKSRAFVESIRGSRDPPATARDALTVTALTEAAYESARTGERVQVDL